jgi:hypothetical protein
MSQRTQVSRNAPKCGVPQDGPFTCEMTKRTQMRPRATVVEGGQGPAGGPRAAESPGSAMSGAQRSGAPSSVREAREANPDCMQSPPSKILLIRPDFRTNFLTPGRVCRTLSHGVARATPVCRDRLPVQTAVQTALLMTFAQEIVIGLTSGAAFATGSFPPRRVAASGVSGRGGTSGSRVGGFAQGRLAGALSVRRGPSPIHLDKTSTSYTVNSRSVPSTPSPRRRGTTSWRFACAFIPR